MNTFEDYQGTPIFEIPIYAFSKLEYRERWKRKETRDVDRMVRKGYSIENAKEFVKKINEHASIWQYNKLVGMLLLTTRKDNRIYCHLYCNVKGPKTIKGEAYLPFRHFFLIDEVIWLKDIHTDAELVSAVKQKIEMLKFVHEINDYYFDCSALEECISVQKVRESISRNIERAL